MIIVCLLLTFGVLLVAMDSMCIGQNLVVLFKFVHYLLLLIEVFSRDGV